MGGGGSRHNHYYPPPPPPPSLTERRTNAQSKIDLEQRNHTSFLQEQASQHRLFQQETHELQDQYARSLQEIEKIHSGQREQQQKLMEHVEHQIQSRIKDLDEELAQLEKTESDHKSKLIQLESKASVTKQESENHKKWKDDKANLLKKQLEEEIQKHEDLTKRTENTLDMWIASRAITEEAVKRLMKISALLLQIPRHGITNSVLDSSIANFLQRYLEQLDPILKSLEEDLKWQTVDVPKTLEWLKVNNFNNPKLLAYVEVEEMTLTDIVENMETEEELSDSLPSWKKKKLCSTLIGANPSEVAQKQFEANLVTLLAEIEPILSWQEAVRAGHARIGAKSTGQLNLEFP